MSVLTFNTDELKGLVEELAAASRYSPTMEDLFNETLYPDGIMRDKQGQTEAEIEAQGGLFWPSSDYIDRNLIRPSLILVGDQGVYLITNADVTGAPASRGTVAYAEGCKPGRDAASYDNKVAMWGGDDGSVAIPPGWAESAMSMGHKQFRIRLSGDRIE
ncbi:MAG: DUF3085 domain-containing protein [Nitrosospira sp.]|nr:DUF3085 domain-containing protein [Nitrosospira sp.]